MVTPESSMSIDATKHQGLRCQGKYSNALEIFSYTRIQAAGGNEKARTA